MMNKIIEKAAKMFARHLEGLFFALVEDRVTYDEYRNYFSQETEEYISHLTKEIQEQNKGTEKKSVFLIYEYYYNGKRYEDVRIIYIASSLEKANEYIKKIDIPYTREGDVIKWIRREEEDENGAVGILFQEFYQGEEYSYNIIEMVIDEE